MLNCATVFTSSALEVDTAAFPAELSVFSVNRFVFFHWTGTEFVPRGSGGWCPQLSDEVPRLMYLSVCFILLCMSKHFVLSPQVFTDATLIFPLFVTETSAAQADKKTWLQELK